MTTEETAKNIQDAFEFHINETRRTIGLLITQPKLEPHERRYMENLIQGLKTYERTKKRDEEDIADDILRQHAKDAQE